MTLKRLFFEGKKKKKRRKFGANLGERKRKRLSYSLFIL